MFKISGKLYDIARTLNRAASKASDIETLLSGDPKKIARRWKNKAINRQLFKLENEVSRKLRRK